jgi:hypothetical protein
MMPCLFSLIIDLNVADARWGKAVRFRSWLNNERQFFGAGA